MLSGSTLPFVLIFFPEDAFPTAALKPPMSWVAYYFGFAGLVATSAVLFVGMGFVGFGLWRLRPWARSIITVVFLIKVCGGIYDCVEAALHHQPWVSAFGLLETGGFALLIYYFNRAVIRHLFSTASSR